MDRQAKQDQIDAAKTAQDQANTTKYTQLYAQQIQDAAKYQVDTDRHIGTGGLIAIALSGIGDALDHQHGPNKALEIIDNGIDKRIADQWAQKKSLGDTAAATKGVLDVYRNNADDDRQAQQFQKAAELSRASDETKMAAAQYANPAARARALALAAGLDQKVAAITQGEAARKAQAVRDAQEQANKQAQLGVSYGDLALRNQEHKDALVQQDRAYALDVAKLQADGMSKQAAAAQAQQNLANAQGFKISAGVDPKSGRESFVQAVQQDGTPYVVADKDQSKEIHERDEGYTGYIHALDDMRQLRQANGGSLGATEEARAMTQSLAQAQMKYMQANGLKRVGDTTLDQAEKAAAGDKGVLDSFVKSVAPNLDNARKSAELERVNMHRVSGQFTGDARQFAIPDPLAAARTDPLGVQLTQPQAPSVATPTYIAPQTNLPSVINNFGGVPVAPTIAPTDANTPTPWHQYVVDQVQKKRK